MTDQSFEADPEAVGQSDMKHATVIGMVAIERDTLKFPSDQHPTAKDTLPGEVGPENFVG